MFSLWRILFHFYVPVIFRILGSYYYVVVKKRKRENLPGVTDQSRIQVYKRWCISGEERIKNAKYITKQWPEAIFARICWSKYWWTLIFLPFWIVNELDRYCQTIIWCFVYNKLFSIFVCVVVINFFDRKP